MTVLGEDVAGGRRSIRFAAVADPFLRVSAGDALIRRGCGTFRKRRKCTNVVHIG